MKTSSKRYAGDHPPLAGLPHGFTGYGFAGLRTDEGYSLLRRVVNYSQRKQCKRDQRSLIYTTCTGKPEFGEELWLGIRVRDGERFVRTGRTLVTAPGPLR